MQVQNISRKHHGNSVVLLVYLQTCRLWSLDVPWLEPRTTLFETESSYSEQNTRWMEGYTWKTVCRKTNITRLLWITAFWFSQDCTGKQHGTVTVRKWHPFNQSQYARSQLIKSKCFDTKTSRARHGTSTARYIYRAFFHILVQNLLYKVISCPVTQR